MGRLIFATSSLRHARLPGAPVGGSHDRPWCGARTTRTADNASVDCKRCLKLIAARDIALRAAKLAPVTAQFAAELEKKGGAR